MVKGFAGNIRNQSHRMQPCKREDERSRILKKMSKETGMSVAPFLMESV